MRGFLDFNPHIFGQSDGGDKESGGSFSNPMYKYVHSGGTYHPVSGRQMRRLLERKRRKFYKKHSTK